ncbi:hypothetical protein, partial [Vibrio parahaemolyticus]|uniref:hypothetical protein n=1 Tax=Vibrio parahaemolyticus TaxID=670 RepID=UPI001C5E8D79
MSAEGISPLLPGSLVSKDFDTDWFIRTRYMFGLIMKFNDVIKKNKHIPLLALSCVSTTHPI